MWPVIRRFMKLYIPRQLKNSVPKKKLSRINRKHTVYVLGEHILSLHKQMQAQRKSTSAAKFERKCIQTPTATILSTFFWQFYWPLRELSSLFQREFFSLLSTIYHIHTANIGRISTFLCCLSHCVKQITRNRWFEEVYGTVRRLLYHLRNHTHKYTQLWNADHVVNTFSTHVRAHWCIGSVLFSGGNRYNSDARNMACFSTPPLTSIHTIYGLNYDVWMSAFEMRAGVQPQYGINNNSVQLFCWSIEKVCIKLW